MYPYNARFLVAARRIMSAALDVTAVQVVGVFLTIRWRFDLYIGELGTSRARIGWVLEVDDVLMFSMERPLGITLHSHLGSL